MKLLIRQWLSGPHLFKEKKKVGTEVLHGGKGDDVRL